MKTFSMTHVGQRRETNQDYMFTSETAVGNLPNLFLVADGMGGYAAGDYASRFTVETMVDYLQKSEETKPVALLRESIAYANHELLAEAAQDPNKHGMGTTIVAATVVDDVLYTANVGDSRLYLLDQNEIRQISKDHSLVEEMVRMGEITKEDARTHPDKHKITRAVGAQEEISVDLFETTLTKDDMILMCSDGLSNMIADEEIRRIVLEQRDLVEMAEALVRRANENGGKDNITVVLAKPFA
jgi:protein phosphatase